MHDINGRPLFRGDTVKIKAQEQPSGMKLYAVGVIVSAQAGSETCNIQVATPNHGLMERQYATAKESELIVTRDGEAAEARATRT